MMEDLRYPIGKFQYAGVATEEQRKHFIMNIGNAPSHLREAVAGLTEEQLKIPYRPEGWTIRQVAHHLPDSHLNAYTRFRLALTEEEPTIRPYHEDRWAELADSRNAPINYSLDLLESLHKRWVYLLESLTVKDFSRIFKHPELGVISLDKNLALYSWHGQHHVAQITSIRQRMNF
jgi:DinB superfamily